MNTLQQGISGTGIAASVGHCCHRSQGPQYGVREQHAGEVKDNPKTAYRIPGSSDYTEEKILLPTIIRLCILTLCTVCITVIQLHDHRSCYLSSLLRYSVPERQPHCRTVLFDRPPPGPKNCPQEYPPGKLTTVHIYSDHSNSFTQLIEEAL